MSNFGESEKTRFTQKAKERKEKHLDGRKVSLFRGKTENGQEMDVTLGIAVSRNAGGGKRERERERKKKKPVFDFFLQISWYRLQKKLHENDRQLFQSKTGGLRDDDDQSYKTLFAATDEGCDSFWA